MYVRYLDMTDLSAKTEYLCTVKLYSKTGQSMFNTIETVWKVLGLPMAKLVGLCTDGDSAMMGQHTGVRGLLRKVCPYLLSAHCAAHKSALVMADVEKLHPLVKQVDDVLRSTHNYFSRSPKKFQAWKRYANMHGITACRFPSFNTTRWFSRMVCLKTMLKNLPHLIRFLSKDSVQRELEGAADLLVEVSQLDVIMAMHGICDVIEPLEHFRLFFQSDHTLPHDVKARVEATCAALDALAAKGAGGGANLKRFWGSLRLPFWSSKPIASGRKVKVELQGSYDVELVEEFLTSFASDIKAHLLERFPDSDVLQCFHIFDPKSYVDLQLGTQLDKFGLTELKQLLKHVGHASLSTRLIDLSEAVTRSQIFDIEFPAMKRALWERSRRRVGLQMAAVWAEFKDQNRVQTMPNLYLLVLFGLIVPLNTACVERGFSHHGIIKNKLRTRLKVVTMDSLLRVKLLADNYKNFDYKMAQEIHGDINTGLISKLASEVDRLQFADLEEDLAAEEQADFTAPPESVTSDDSGFDFSASESDEEGADAVEVVSGAAPPTLLNAAALTNAAELANELGF